MTEAFHLQVARLMRESADLVEQELVRVDRVDIDFETVDLYGSYGSYLTRRTGFRIVTIRLSGFDGTMRAWQPPKPPKLT